MSADEQTAQEDAAEDRQEVANVERHDCEHAENMSVVGFAEVQVSATKRQTYSR